VKREIIIAGILQVVIVTLPLLVSFFLWSADVNKRLAVMKIRITNTLTVISDLKKVVNQANLGALAVRVDSLERRINDLEKKQDNQNDRNLYRR
jgi:cell division protein FtsB